MSSIHIAPSSDLVATSPDDAITTTTGVAASATSPSTANATDASSTATPMASGNGSNAALLISQKRGSVGSINGVMLAGSNNIIACRPGKYHPGSSKREGCGKQDAHQAHANHECPQPIATVIIAEVESSDDARSPLNREVDNRVSGRDYVADEIIAMGDGGGDGAGDRPNDDDDDDDDDESSSLSDDSLDDYQSAFSSHKDDLFWADESSSGTHKAPPLPPIVDSRHAHRSPPINNWSPPEPSTITPSPRCIVSPSPRALHANAAVASSSSASAPFPSSARQSARRVQKLTRAAQRIAGLNEAAVGFYRAGEYDATLDALREAEGRRRKLVQTLALEQGWEWERHVVGASSATAEAAPCPADEAKMGATSSNASVDSMCNRSQLQQQQNDEEVNKLGAGVARTSYIYQRMDFDEGMHSFANVEAIEASKFWTVGPSSVYAPKDNMKCYEVSPIVEATLVFNVGQVHRRRGEFDAAAKSYDRALEILQIATGFVPGEVTNKNVIQHPVVIPILHNVGQLQYRRGDLNVAMTTYTSALKHAQILYGPRHVHAASALNCLGVLHYHANSSESDEDSTNSAETTKKNGKPERSSTRKAMGLFRQALSIRTENLGPDHVDVATTLNNIGRIHVQQDEFDKALHFYEDALVIRRKRLGTNSLDYAATAFNAGQSLHQKGELDQAVELYREFLRVALMKFGHSHRDVAVVLSGIAQIHQEKREYDKALELYEESLCAGRAALGEYHSEIAMLLNRMGNFYFERERLEDALRCYRRGLRIERRVLPTDHPNIVVTLSNLGEIHRQRYEWDDAATMYCDALEILRKKYENHVDIASTLNTIGLIHDQRGDACLSLRYLQEALIMRRKLLGDDHIDVSATLVYIGTILYRKSVFSVAMELFSEALRIRQTVLGRDHRDVAFALYNIALVHQQRGCYEQAIEYYAETLRVEKIVLGERHRDVSMTLFKLGEVNKAAGDLEEALKCFQKSLDIERSLDESTSSSESDGGRRPQQTSSDPAAMARTLNEIGNIHLARGDVVPMMDAFNEASRLYRTAGLSPNNVVVSGHLYALEFSCPEAAPAA